MKTQHTPGPWTVDNQYIHGPDGIRFLAVAGDGAGQANARLIASAPDLYAALETLLEHEGEIKTNAIGLDLDSYALQQAKEHARAALAKATATQ